MKSKHEATGKIVVGAHIDNGFYAITEKEAKRLSGSRLPGCGKERLVSDGASNYWLTKTQVNGSSVWSVRKTDWKLENGRAVLRCPQIKGELA